MEPDAVDVEIPPAGVERQTRELSSFSTHLQSIAEREKAQLARTLHDELGGLLTAAKMDLSWIQSRLEAPAIQTRLMQLGNVLDEAMDLKRRVVEELRPSLLDHFGLPTTVRAYVESTCGRVGLTAHVSIEHPCETLSKEAAIALFRIVQEGVSNVIRHARAKLVRLEVSGDDSRCVVSLSDDGGGFDVAASDFRYLNGLLGVRQRVTGLGGRMDLDSKPGRGTTLRVEVPMRKAG